MTFYRVAYMDDEDTAESKGFSWHSSRIDAELVASKAVANTVITEHQIHARKWDILDALNRYASHPDNG